ncbi:MAG TPA: hypothetical protein VFS72_11515 [Agromyces sp.]|nr:hypothetical protein [Agromyces sp.]
MARFDPDAFIGHARGQAYVEVTRTAVDARVRELWDGSILREPRVCVPIDVQALIVAQGVEEQTAGVRLVGPLSPGAMVGPDAAPDARARALAGPDPFAEPVPREHGVHLHWAMPDALMRARLQDPRAVAAGDPAAQGVAGKGPTSAGGGLGMAPLPDRWLVLRLLLPASGGSAVATGWVVDALTGRTWPLAEFTGDTTRADDATAAVPPEGLTGSAGGTATWTAGYDAAGGRFTFHDPLRDLEADPTLGGTLPGGPVEGRATYLVVGWWSVADLDPLDEVRGSAALDRRLDQLAWYRIAPDGSQPEPPLTLPTIGPPSLGPLHLPALDLPVTARAPVLPSVLHSMTTSSATAAGLRGRPGAGASFVRPKHPPRPEASTLVHGAVLGVPVVGELAKVATGAERRPERDAAELAFGESLFDAVGALTAAHTAERLGAVSDEERELVERLMAAFVQHSVHRLADPNGAATIDEELHAAGFAAVAAGEPGIEDRVVDRKVDVPRRGRRIGVAGGPKRPGRVVPDPGTVFVARSARDRRLVAAADPATTALAARESAGASEAVPTAPAVRTELRPAPSRFVPSDPYVVVRGAGRALRHGGDGRWTHDGKLLVRHPSQIGTGYKGVLSGAQVLEAIASGAVPAEATALAREALLVSPHALGWLARRATAVARGRVVGRNRPPVEPAIMARLEAELLLRFDAEGRYTTLAAATGVEGERSRVFRRAGDVDSGRVRVADALAVQSAFEGVLPSEVGVTAWSQPWCPLWLEYEVEIASTDVADGTGAPGPVVTAGDPAWVLGQTDLEATDAAPPAPTVLTVASRVPLTTGAAAAVGGAVAQYIDDETDRDETGDGEIDDALTGQLGGLADVAGAADLLGASLDGTRRRLLGLAARELHGKDADGSPVAETPEADPRLLVAGSVRLARLRLLDTFGRVLELDPATAVVPARLEVRDAPDAAPRPATMRRSPRFSAPARVQVRLIGAAATAPADAVNARVDEVEPARAVNPVAGFLLPDHVDESLEVFAADGAPLGEVLVEGASGPSGGGVVWEPAPGRPVPHDAAPSVGLAPEQECLGLFAAGLVLADASARSGRRADEDADSALSALIRAIDTTLWTVDPVGGAGSSDLAAIVGRPLAVVRALVEVDVAPDVDVLELTSEAGARRAAAFAELAQVGVRVRLGELTRPDDGLVAWFVDDDFTHVHVVDAAVADLARPLGSGRGFLTSWGRPPEEWTPGSTPIEHPYVVADSELVVHPGAPRLVTLLMAPGASVYATSGIVPRTRVQLQRSWFGPALDRLVPSIRVGPVLVDPGDVRLPLVAALGAEQTLTTREGPIGWRDDAILAASSSALLPDRATVLREGWVRVSPEGGEPD